MTGQKTGLLKFVMHMREEIPDFMYSIRKNGGVSVARKAGFEKSSGDILYWIDADDYISPDLLEKRIFFLKKKMQI